MPVPAVAWLHEVAGNFASVSLLLLHLQREKKKTREMGHTLMFEVETSKFMFDTVTLCDGSEGGAIRKFPLHNRCMSPCAGIYRSYDMRACVKYENMVSTGNGATHRKMMELT